MRVLWVAAGSLLSVLLAMSPAAGQLRESQDQDLNSRLKQMVESSFLTVHCAVPQIQPAVAPLKRSTAPDAEKLISGFLGPKEALMGTEDIVSPLWGPGHRYKSGMVIYLAFNEQLGIRSITGPAQKVESVPVFLDIYSSGFVYANNIPHTAVYATDVKVETETKADVTRHNVYSEHDGQAAAEALVAEKLGKLTVPAGFQTNVKSLIQHFGERLFAYRVNPEYLTSYQAKGANGEAVSNPVAVPVYDSYVHILLDGDKLLAGMEYFWDGGLTVVGGPKPCISAADAILKAREGLLKRFNSQPPLLSVTDIKLGFVQDRRDRTKLVPAWLFDAWYTEWVEEQKPGTKLTGRKGVQVPLPFGVNALSGEFFEL